MPREAAPILLVRKGRFLVAADFATDKFLERLPQNKVLRARDITQPRSRGRNRLYWSLVHLVADNLTDVPAESLHEWLKVRLGITVAIPLKSGKVEYVPGSIAFDQMSEEDFAPYLDRVIDLLCGEILPGLGRDDLLSMANEMTGRLA